MKSMKRESRMRLILILGIFLLLVGCSSSNVATFEAINPQESRPAGTKSLQLVFNDAGNAGHSLTLEARDAHDLYQIAGTIEYDPARYQISGITQADGLGESSGTYFAWGEREPGRIDFGITKRYSDPGVSGTVALLALDVVAANGLRLSDFSIDDSPDGLIARDSLKHRIAATFATGGLQ